jgi:hypothetical protein
VLTLGECTRWYVALELVQWDQVGHYKVGNDNYQHGGEVLSDLY